MILNIDISMLHDDLLKQLSLYHFSAVSPSSESSSKVERPPLLTQELLPLLQAFYVVALRKTIARIQGWIDDVKISESTISIVISENLNGGRKSVGISESNLEMISEMIRYVCELYVLSEIYASYNKCLSEKFVEQMEEMINLLLEFFALRK